MEITGGAIRRFVADLEAQAQGNAQSPSALVATAFKAAFPAAFTPVNITDRCTFKGEKPYADRYCICAFFGDINISHSSKDDRAVIPGVGRAWVAEERYNSLVCIRVWCLPD